MAGVRRRQRRKRRDNNTNNRSEEEIDDNKKLEELLLDVVKDPRVFLIKIAERLHNMRTLYTWTRERRRPLRMKLCVCGARLPRSLGYGP